jgi:hypothetical protein
MRLRTQTTLRRGMVLPVVALCILALMGMIALAIDLGMVAVARTQCQNAADAAAMAGGRTINGDATVNYNYNSVSGAAVTAAVANKVLNQNVQGDPSNLTNVGPTDAQGNYYTFTSGQVKVEVGTYAYTYNDANPSQEGFAVQIPRTDTAEPYSAVRVTVTGGGSAAFGRIFGINSFNTSAQATAVHRPRDVMMIVDLSGSMRFQSLPGTPMSGSYAVPNSISSARTQSLNPESVFPQFGHYSNVSGAALQGTTLFPTTSDVSVPPSNFSSTQNSGPPICADWYANPVGIAPGPSNVAFTRAPDNYSTAPGGDNYLQTAQDKSASYAQTVSQVVTNATYDTTFEANGYDAYRGAGAFKGYTQGPGYWGKTFWIWPPDPRGPPAATWDPSNSANYANNGARDWRQRFFFKYNTATGALDWLDHDSILWDTSTGAIKAPGATTTVTEGGTSVTYTYRINYAAILQWLFNQSPAPFPSTLQAGRIRYYSSLPNPGDTTLNNRWWTTAPLSDLNERFWKDYIDFVLGLKGTGAGTYTNLQFSVPLSALIGNGDYFTWGSFQVSQKPDPYTATAYQSSTVNASSGYSSGYNGSITVKTLSSLPSVNDYVFFGTSTTPYRVASASSTTTFTLNRPLAAAVANGAAVKFVRAQYLNYTDNPRRLRHQFWFGPMTMVDYLGNYNTNLFWWPGNVHEAQAWACKVGVQSAIGDIQNNHPNDFIGLTFFSNPKTSATGSGQHNQVVVPLGRSYQQLKDSLWFPPTTVTGGVTEITPYSADMANVPRANGGTAPQMDFMIAYNQFSSSTTNLRFYAQPAYQLPSAKTPNYRGWAGGLGRKGAARLIVFETDGVPNFRAFANLAGNGSDPYYPIRIGNPQNVGDSSLNTEWPSSGTYSNTEVYNVVQQICALNTASPPGFATQRKPVQVWCIGYGDMYDPANAGTNQTSALTFLQTVMYYGNTATDTNSSNFPMWLRIYGSNDNRIANLRTALTNIMQGGIQVSLVQ